jgi:putative membrane protein
MTKAAQGGIAEVDLGQLAAAKATSVEVKEFGNRMVTDHTRLNDELKALATSKGGTLPSETDAENKKAFDAIATKSGKAFDKAYMSDMVKDHEKDVAEFEKESTAAQDPDLKKWVTNALPTLQDHLKMAKQINAKLK